MIRVFPVLPISWICVLSVCSKTAGFIIGVGSPFGDDQVGWLVIDAIQKQVTSTPFLEEFIYLEKLDRPQLNLLANIKNANLVILIDAVVTSAAPIGTLWHFTQQDIANKNAFISTHGIGIMETLALGEALGNLPENILLYGIEIDPVGKFSAISPKVLQAIQPLADKITAHLYDKLNFNFQ